MYALGLREKDFSRIDLGDAILSLENFFDPLHDDFLKGVNDEACSCDLEDCNQKVS
jgi:hypothetical protein